MADAQITSEHKNEEMTKIAPHLTELSRK